MSMALNWCDCTLKCWISVQDAVLSAQDSPPPYGQMYVGGWGAASWLGEACGWQCYACCRDGKDGHVLRWLQGVPRGEVLATTESPHC